MKLPSWLRGESKGRSEEAGEAASDGEPEKVSVPFGKPAPAKRPAKPTKGAKPRAEGGTPKPKPKDKSKPKAKLQPKDRQKPRGKLDDDRRVVEESKSQSRRKLARRTRDAAAEKPAAESPSERSQRRRRARAAEPESTRTRRGSAVGPKATEARNAIGGSLKEGTEETRKRASSALPGLGSGMLKLAGAAFAIFFDVLGFALGILIAVALLVAGPGRALLARARRVVDAASRQLTPSRALALTVAGAAVLLALSQFADYRGVSISTDAYSGVETVAPAPQIERAETGDAHGYAFVPVAGVALLLLAGAMAGRWKLCRLIALCGIAAIVVGLVVDRPAGLDPGEAALAFDGVEGELLGGFYAQLFAGLLLTVAALLLGRALRVESSAAKAAPARTQPGKQRLRLPRPRRGAEEARA